LAKKREDTLHIGLLCKQKAGGKNVFFYISIALSTAYTHTTEPHVRPPNQIATCKYGLLSREPTVPTLIPATAQKLAKIFPEAKMAEIEFCHYWSVFIFKLCELERPTPKLV
jgi:hypothetical protein